MEIKRKKNSEFHSIGQEEKRHKDNLKIPVDKNISTKSFKIENTMRIIVKSAQYLHGFEYSSPGRHKFND